MTDLLGRPRKQGEFPDWEVLYQSQAVETMPWYLEVLDHDLERALTEWGPQQGHLLDLGTGPGTQAMLLSRRGYQVTASDLSATAVALAAAKAREQGLAIDFRQDDILASRLDGPFHGILDRGCFHVLPPARRQDYVAAVAGMLAVGGRLWLKCFSDRETSERGPYRFAPAMIPEIFGSGWRVVAQWESRFEGEAEPKPLALFTILEPRP